MRKWYLSYFVRTIAILTALVLCSNVAYSATMYSLEKQEFGPGTFYGPGSIDDTPLFPVIIYDLGFVAPTTFITPFVNNGAEEPNICGEKALKENPTGTLSDGVTRINENVDVCPFELNGMKILVSIIDGGPHTGGQVATMTDDGHMVMSMDTAMDLGVGKPGIIRIPFYATTGEVTVPLSLQTQMRLPGGLDQAGSQKSGTVLKGRLGDYNNDGMLDGAIVLAGNIPMDSMLLPGAPYAFIRYFETDVPYDGDVYGKLKVQLTQKN